MNDISDRSVAPMPNPRSGQADDRDTIIAPSSYWFEDFHVGQTLVTSARTITAAELATFAGLTGDFMPIHMDAEFAARSEFGERIAHGLLGLVIAQGLIALTGHIHESGLASLSWNNWRFKLPIRIGDSVHVRLRIAALRDSASRPGAGIVTEQIDLINQDGQVTQTGEHISLIRKRKVQPAPDQIRPKV
ncbi:MAG: MaoC family dehydratase N-terminal domain-containing protein [Rhodobiaceae bacterium]|nr:MaoC family dehydratase N-terminal domain-containing protein [Rhodobiaceae bacterium]MCC0057099.1 MaoC family dehydratase N-terminal domain-containing protein [Rhodobiaceae bacterium]